MADFVILASNEAREKEILWWRLTFIKSRNILRYLEREIYIIIFFSKGGFTEGLKALGDKGEVKLIAIDDMY